MNATNEPVSEPVKAKTAPKEVPVFISSTTNGISLSTKRGEDGELEKFMTGHVNGHDFKVPVDQQTYVTPDVYEAIERWVTG